MKSFYKKTLETLESKKFKSKSHKTFFKLWGYLFGILILTTILLTSIMLYQKNRVDNGIIILEKEKKHQLKYIGDVIDSIISTNEYYEKNNIGENAENLKNVLYKIYENDCDYEDIKGVVFCYGKILRKEGISYLEIAKKIKNLYTDYKEVKKVKYVFLKKIKNIKVDTDEDKILQKALLLTINGFEKLPLKKKIMVSELSLRFSYDIEEELEKIEKSDFMRGIYSLDEYAKIIFEDLKKSDKKELIDGIETIFILLMLDEKSILDYSTILYVQNAFLFNLISNKKTLDLIFPRKISYYKKKYGEESDVYKFHEEVNEWKNKNSNLPLWFYFLIDSFDVLSTLWILIKIYFIFAIIAILYNLYVAMTKKEDEEDSEKNSLISKCPKCGEFAVVAGFCNNCGYDKEKDILRDLLLQ